MMKAFFIVFVIFSTVLSASPQSRVFKQRIRDQDGNDTLPAIEKEQDDHESSSEVIGSTDNVAALARVQRDQAETFKLWSNQFQQFKNSVIKFMDQTSDVLQKNDKKIKTLQRVVRKIAHDIDE